MKTELTARTHQLRSGGTSTPVAFPHHKCIQQLFEEQVDRTPEAVAIVFHDQALTYRELNQRADRLADKLHTAGVGADIPVGLCVKRSLEMVVSMLAVLKAGGCYVPLDPTYPQERLAFMLNDSQPRVLLTQEKLKAQLNLDFENGTVICVDDVLEISDQPISRSTLLANLDRNEGDGSISDNLAYIIYTSGSTGKPKGVMLSHRNVVNFFTAMDHILGSDPGTWLAVTSISFDISVLEILWTLTRGFKVVIQPEHHPASTPSPGEQDGQTDSSIPAQILKHGVTHFQCTPSLASTLLASASLPALQTLKSFLVGGEALPVSLAAQLRQAVSGNLFNMYGPTETAVWSTAYRINNVNGSMPIGHPIANTEIHILNEKLETVANGESGEIFIGGEGVARGYLNQPALTSERFVNRPSNSDPAARLYRTGDLGRWRADGVLEFLGRVDQQVKVRGHRIELGEIESALRQHSAVRDCVVSLSEVAANDQRLIAYVVLDSQNSTLAGELRQFLAAKLPDYMMPAAFVQLEKLPLTPNGKVDRKALPALTSTPLQKAGTATPAPTGLEERIAKIWSELLRVENVGRHDNFFDLGGHSLLATQAHTKMCEALGLDFPIMRLFEYPTISSLATFLNQRKVANLPAHIQARAQRQREALSLHPHQEVAA